MVEMAPHSHSRRWIWHPISLCDTILYSIDIYYTILYSAMVEMSLNPFQENGFGIPSRDMVLYYTQLTYTILYSAVCRKILYSAVLSFAVVEMASNTFQEGGSGIPPHYMILYYTPLTYTILYSAILSLYNTVFIFCNAGAGT